MGIVTVLAGVALFAASGLLIVFFVNQSETADRAANWFFLAFYVLMAWSAIEVHRFYADSAGYTWILTVVVVAALTTSFVSTLLVVAGRVPFTRVATPTTVGFLVLMLWMLAVSILILTKGGLTEGLGWLGVATMTLGLLVVGGLSTDREMLTGEKVPGKGVLGFFVVILVGLTTWIIWLGLAATTAI